jgi:hypothetical protein
MASTIWRMTGSGVADVDMCVSPLPTMRGIHACTVVSRIVADLFQVRETGVMAAFFARLSLAPRHLWSEVFSENDLPDRGEGRCLPTG